MVRAGLALNDERISKHPPSLRNGAAGE